MNEKLRIAAISAVLVMAIAAVAQAECPAVCGHGYGGYYGYLPSYVYVRDYIPYFAMHPPVYYSLPVPRTYGYSPFAYPPGTMTPDIAEPEPVVIQNKFVPSKDGPKPEPGKVTQKPLRITNPFVVAKQSSATEGMAAVR